MRYDHSPASVTGEQYPTFEVRLTDAPDTSAGPDALDVRIGASNMTNVHTLSPGQLFVLFRAIGNRLADSGDIDSDLWFRMQHMEPRGHRPEIGHHRAAAARGLGVKIPVPVDFPVRPLVAGQPAKDRMTCGTCHRSWDDAVVTEWTPAPSGRCPFEYFH